MFQMLYDLISTPFGYVMRLIYEFIGSYGLSIILFSLLVKLVTLPLTIKQKKSMFKTQRLQPKLQQLQKQYGKDQNRLREEMQNLYDKEGVTPMSGCGTTLLMFPLLIGVYGVVSQPLTYFMQLTAEQITTIAEKLNFTMSTGYGAQIGLAGQIFDNFDLIADVSDKLLKVDFNFLFVNLSAVPSFKEPSLLWAIPIIAGITAYLQSLVTKWSQKRNTPVSKKKKNTDAPDPTAQTNAMMTWMMPAMSLYFCFIMPCGLGLYWIANNVFGIAQEYLLQKFLIDPMLETEEGDM